METVRKATEVDMTAKSLVIMNYRDYLIKNKKQIIHLKEKNEANQKKLIERYQNNPHWFKEKQGGVTDGGGNVVDGMLYDFWVAEGTLEISFEDLLKWNSDLKKMLEFMQSFSPPASDLGHKGWVEELIASGSRQRWIFDMKPLRNVDCWNLSPNISEYQEVMGCNSLAEVRIYAPAFFDLLGPQSPDLTTFQSGFIMHELLLSWARAKHGSRMRKFDLELAVQRINVALRSRQNLMQTIRLHLPASDLLTSEEIESLRQIKIEIDQEGAKICRRETIQFPQHLFGARGHRLVRRYLGRSLDQLWNAIQTEGTEMGSLYRNLFCFDQGFYKNVPINQLSLYCRNVIEKNIEVAISEKVEISLGLRLHSPEAIPPAQRAAQVCFDTLRTDDLELKAEVYLQALEYFRRLLSRSQ
jgi:hypothetical protein